METTASTGWTALVRFASTVPKSVGVFSDLDGTLSRIVANPDEARPVEGAVSAINALAKSSGRTAIVSGRPVSFLGRFFGGPVELSGLYGIEHQRGDGLSIHPEAVGWLPVIEAVNNDAVERFGAAVAENKGYSLTVHYREVEQDTADEIMAWSERVSEEHGLHARSAKKSVELHPPISRNKGDAIADMLEGLSAAVYFGDDFGDRSGFERVLAAHGSGRLDVVATVLVNGAETPPELASVATDTVGSPGDVVALLNELSKACDEAP